MKYLIVNADDFGLSDYINEGIIKGHQAGIITSATLMIKREYTRAAVRLSKGNRSLCVGLHLDLDDYLGRDETGTERFGMERISRQLEEPLFFQEMKRLLKKNRIRVANHFVKGWQPYDLRSIGDGVTELMVHPGTKEEWRIKELETLESREWIDAVKAVGIRLISFRDLAEVAID